MSSICPVVSENMFENVDGRTTVIGILIAHLGAIGSGELKQYQGKGKCIQLFVHMDLQLINPKGVHIPM